MLAAPTHSGNLLLQACLVLFGVMVAGQVYAQAPDEGSIEGVVIEAASGDPLEAASVAAFAEADSSLVSGVATEEEGEFDLTGLVPGRYFVEVQFLGYGTATVSNIEVEDGETVDLGLIELTEDDRQLDELDVVAERDYQEQGIDRTVYNTGDQPITTGGSAVDVLETIPSLDVDLDGNISLRGSQGIEIYINGRPAPMSGDALTGFLRGLNADDVERVETMPNPSARHQPEGSAGIVNIVLAQDAGDGLGGSISASTGTGDRHGGSGTLRYGHGPWMLSGTLGTRYRQRTSSTERFRENRFASPLTYLEQDQDGHRTGLSHYLNSVVEYEFDEANSMRLSSMVSQRSRERDQHSSYRQLDGDETLSAHYDRTTIGEDYDFDLDFRLDYRHVVEPGSHELTAEARFQRDVDREDRHFQNDFIMLNEALRDLPDEEEQLVNQNELSNDFSVQLDYERPLGDRLNLEAGYRGSFERLDSELFSELRLRDEANFIPDEGQNNEFVYDELLNAAYGVVGGEFGDLGLQAGLRLEQAQTSFNLRSAGDIFQNSYFSFFPSVHARYNLLEHLSLNASYSKRLSRPRTWQLNPFDNQQDPTYRRVGNPYLEPEYTHSGEIGISQMGERYTANVSTYFRRTVNSIEWNEQLNEEGVSVRTFENFDTRDSYGVELSGSLRLGDVRFNGSLNGFRRVTDGSNIDDDLSQGAFGYMTRLRGTWNVGGGFSMQFMQFYFAPMQVAGGSRGGRMRTNIAFRQQLMDDRLQLNLSARGIFSDRSRETVRDTERYFQRSVRERSPRGISLSLQYTFSGGEERGGGGGRGGRRGR